MSKIVPAPVKVTTKIEEIYRSESFKVTRNLETGLYCFHLRRYGRILYVEMPPITAAVISEAIYQSLPEEALIENAS
jgi:hypothetical protein